MSNQLKGKTLLWNGDSICMGTAEWGNWATRIAEKNEANCHNYGKGGGTVAEKTPPHANGQERHYVCQTLDVMYQEHPDADYVILEGGTNDADLLKLERLGAIQPGYDKDSFDTTTFCGALESVFCRAVTYWKGKKIGFIVAQKMGLNLNEAALRRFYFDKAVEICIKWGIPYLDLWNGCYLNPFISSMYDATKTAEQNKTENTGYYVDSQHLTSLGYDVTADIIDTWLKTL